MLVLLVLWLAVANLSLVGTIWLSERRRKKRSSGRRKQPPCG
jgi:hypothetical protein